MTSIFARFEFIREKVVLTYSELEYYRRIVINYIINDAMIRKVNSTTCTKDGF
ncbi:hypothetical protein BANRA_01620 [Escherichia coli]|nr:hypothetical protein BANRA_01620 [Escherichia coli]